MNEQLKQALIDRPGWVGEILPTAVDGRAVVGNPINGDVLYLGISIDRSTETITEALWRVEGSDMGIACISLAVRKLLHASLEDVRLMTVDDICVLLKIKDNSLKHHIHFFYTALQKACNGYFAKTGQRERITKEERTIICACADVSDFDIRQVYLRGNQRLKDIQEATGAGKECDMCTERLVDFHAELLREFPMNGNVHIRS